MTTISVIKPHRPGAALIRHLWHALERAVIAARRYERLRTTRVEPRRAALLALQTLNRDHGAVRQARAVAPTERLD